MKATGIVRRVDDLGRIVIPKEIRRTLRIREGDPSLTTPHQSTDFVWRYIVLCKEYQRSRFLLRWYDMGLFILVNISIELFEQTYIKTKNFFCRTPCTIQSKLPVLEEIGFSFLVEE